MTTIVLLNPMGADVTPFLNHTWGIPQLLKGTVVGPGDKVYKVPYVNQAGVDNVEQGVTLLDAALHSITGPKKVFAYSEGGQAADWWLASQGQSTPISPSELSFLSIANANSKHGGFVYNHSQFDQVGYTAGQPASTDYDYTIFTRQYDGVSDFPGASAIQSALIAVQNVVNSSSAMSATMHTLATLFKDPDATLAAENAVAGMVLIHNWYLDVTLADADNCWYTDPTSGIVYGWSPTYPIPLLGAGITLPSIDRDKRNIIETFYNRPVALPLPDYTRINPVFDLPAYVPPPLQWVNAATSQAADETGFSGPETTTTSTGASPTVIALNNRKAMLSFNQPTNPWGPWTYTVLQTDQDGQTSNPPIQLSPTNSGGVVTIIVLDLIPGTQYRYSIAASCGSVNVVSTSSLPIVALI